MDASSHFRGKKITVMGLGVLGRGVGDVRYLASAGAELIVTDSKSTDDLASSIEALADLKGITYVFGEHRLEDFRGRDLILKAAGVPLDSMYIKEAEKEKIPVRMSADLFAEYANVPIVGITGTRGKSTTTYMAKCILEKAGKKVLLGGNVRGVSTLALLSEVEGNEIAVLELDSWQLQGFGTLKRSPEVAVFTTFYSDHLNYYHNDKNLYLADKAKVFLNQKPEDTLVLGNQCAPLIKEKYLDKIKSKIVIADTPDLMDWSLKVPGMHNRYDAACALAAARALGVPDDVSKEALSTFAGVPGRLEFVREVKGVKIYNDTTATTPEATVAALRALDTGKNVVLIMGGSSKNLDMTLLSSAMKEHTKHVSFLEGTGTRCIAGNAPMFPTLEEALKDAVKAAAPGDNILFSPAFASFGMFKNEYDRGDSFMALVRAL